MKYVLNINFPPKEEKCVSVRRASIPGIHTTQPNISRSPIRIRPFGLVEFNFACSQMPLRSALCSHCVFIARFDSRSRSIRFSVYRTDGGTLQSVAEMGF